VITATSIINLPRIRSIYTVGRRRSKGAGHAKIQGAHRDRLWALLHCAYIAPFFAPRIDDNKQLNISAAFEITNAIGWADSASPAKAFESQYLMEEYSMS
jgi:hypothetical protein